MRGPLGDAVRDVRGHPRVAVVGDGARWRRPDTAGRWPAPSAGGVGGVPLDHPALTVPLGPRLDLGAPAPRVARQLDDVVLRERRHRQRRSTSSRGTRQRGSPRVLPQASTRQVPVERAADQGGGVTGGGAVERQDDPLRGCDDPVGVGAGRPTLPTAATPRRRSPTARGVAGGTPARGRLAGSLEAVLGQERIVARQRRVARCARPPGRRSRTLRGGELPEVERGIVAARGRARPAAT